MQQRKLIYTNKQVTLYELITQGYKFSCFDKRTYINIGDGYCIQKLHLIKNINAKYRVKSIEALIPYIYAVYNQKKQLIYKRNRKGVLVKVRFERKRFHESTTKNYRRTS